MKITAAIIAAAIAGPAVADAPEGADLALAIAVMEWTDKNCPEGSVPPQAFMLGAFLDAFGGDQFLPAAREELAAELEKTKMPRDQVCRTFSEGIGEMMGRAAKAMNGD